MPKKRGNTILKYIQEHVLLVGILAIYFLLGLFRLNEIPGEWFGDISNLREYVDHIAHGSFPVNFHQGVGPLYHYIITPFVLLIGDTYLHIKLYSVVSGVASIAGVYLLMHKFFSKTVASCVTALFAWSFWFLVWVRLGNLLQIMPAVTALSVYFLYRFYESKNTKWLVFSGFTASLGWFLYFQTVILPVALVVLYFTLPFSRKEKISFLPVLLASMIPGFCLFILGIMQEPYIIFSPEGYIGEKFSTFSSFTPISFGLHYGKNFFLQLGGLLWKGESIFRINVPHDPMLDPVSRVLFIVGTVSLLRKKYKLQALFIFVPLIILFLPGSFPTIRPEQIPSATRTFGAIPFVFGVLGFGILEVYNVVRKHSQTAARGALGVVVIASLLFTMEKYFFRYPQTLPNKNAAFGKQIAGYIHSLPQEAAVYLTDCCWGQYGEPEPLGIYHQLQNREGRTTLLKSEFVTWCSQVDVSKDTVLIFRPDAKERIAMFTGCFADAGEFVLKSADGQAVAGVVRISKRN